MSDKKNSECAQPQYQRCNWNITISFKVFSLQRYPKRRETGSLPRNFLGHAPRHREQYPTRCNKRSRRATNFDFNWLFFLHEVSSIGINPILFLFYVMSLKISRILSYKYAHVCYLSFSYPSVWCTCAGRT